MITEKINNKSIAGFFQLVDHSVIDWILILGQPVCQVVVYYSSIMSNCKVSTF